MRFIRVDKPERKPTAVSTSKKVTGEPRKVPGPLDPASQARRNEHKKGCQCWRHRSGQMRMEIRREK